MVWRGVEAENSLAPYKIDPVKYPSTTSILSTPSTLRIEVNILFFRKKKKEKNDREDSSSSGSD